MLFKYRGVADLKKAQIYPSIDEEEFLHLHDDIRSTELPRSTFFFFNIIFYLFIVIPLKRLTVFRILIIEVRYNSLVLWSPPCSQLPRHRNMDASALGLRHATAISSTLLKTHRMHTLLKVGMFDKVFLIPMWKQASWWTRGTNQFLPSQQDVYWQNHCAECDLHNQSISFPKCRLGVRSPSFLFGYLLSEICSLYGKWLYPIGSSVYWEHTSFWKRI